MRISEQRRFFIARLFLTPLLFFFTCSNLHAAEPEKTFYENGNIKEERTAEGVKTYAPNGGLLYEDILKDGKLIRRNYDPNLVGPGELQATTRTFFKDGAVYKKVSFDNAGGVVEIREFDPDGELLSKRSREALAKDESDLKSGVKDGTFQAYNVAGEMTETVYSKGKIVSEKFYDPSGKPKNT